MKCPPSASRRWPGRPAHEEVSERIAQILRLADDEAKAQKSKADDDISKLRSEAQQESERVRADAREQAERMLTAAQEQAERTISAARNEADKTRTAARTEADRLTSDTRKKADAALANAKSQAKKVLDEATARATAIHDGAERRLNLLSTRHAETVRRLTDILDGVQGLVAAEAARMSLEEEVNQSVSKAVSLAEAADSGDGKDADDLDLALLAPPAPETVAVGTPAPPRDAQQGHRRTAAAAPVPARVWRPGAPAGPADAPAGGPGPMPGGPCQAGPGARSQGAALAVPLRPSPYPVLPGALVPPALLAAPAGRAGRTASDARPSRCQADTRTGQAMPGTRRLGGWGPRAGPAWSTLTSQPRACASWSREPTPLMGAPPAESAARPSAFLAAITSACPGA